MSARRRVRFVVTGRVQGVGFRAHTQREATQLGVVGHVRNRDDGAVEGEAEGDAAAIAALVDWLGRGPAWARVDSLGIDELPPGGTEREFGVQR